MADVRRMRQPASFYRSRSHLFYLEDIATRAIPDDERDRIFLQIGLMSDRFRCKAVAVQW